MIWFKYDAAGRLVKEGSKTYTYGYLDKVMSVTEGDKTYTYTYHADGQLASANYGGKTEGFLWDGLALVRRGDEQFVNEPHVGGGNPVASSKGTSYFNDMLGTTVGAKKGRQIFRRNAHGIWRKSIRRLSNSELQLHYWQALRRRPRPRLPYAQLPRRPCQVADGGSHGLS